MYMDTNAYLGVVGNRLVGTKPLIGTLDAYNRLCLAQLQELWSNYGDLAEVWFDGGFNKTIQPNVSALFSKLQPGGVVFNGPGDPIGPQNALRWIGSERGYAPYPNWMTTFRNSGVPAVAGAGDPDGLIYAPSVCDTTLQDPTSTWLFDPFHAQPRNLSDLKLLYLLRTTHNYNESYVAITFECMIIIHTIIVNIHNIHTIIISRRTIKYTEIFHVVDTQRGRYHQSVGRSCGLELNFAPMPNGTLAPSFVSRLSVCPSVCLAVLHTGILSNGALARPGVW